jgi:hypothetical protein
MNGPVFDIVSWVEYDSSALNWEPGEVDEMVPVLRIGVLNSNTFSQVTRCRDGIRVGHETGEEKPCQ